MLWSDCIGEGPPLQRNRSHLLRKKIRPSVEQIAKGSSWYICEFLYQIINPVLKCGVGSFFFTLQEFAKESISLVDAMSRICEIQRANARRKSWKHILSFPWRILRSRSRSIRRRTRTTQSATLSKRICMYRFLLLYDVLNVLLSATFFLPEPAHRSVSFPKVTPHAPNTKQTPAREELSLMGRLNQSLWALGARLKEKDIKYAFKVGMATAMLAAPAFFDATRPIFVEYRGEWALISVII